MDAVVVILIMMCLLVAYPLMRSIRVVPEHERLVIMRLGRYAGTRDPGMVFVVPLLERGIRVDMRERFLEIPSQTVSTKDNVPVAINFRVHYRVIDPQKTVIQVHHVVSASQNVAVTTLRAVIGDIELISVLSRHDEISETLRVKLDEIMQTWGMQVTGIEIREIKPLDEVVKQL